MSIDTTVASVLAAIEAQTAALTRNSDLLERVVAGQEAAMAKLEGSPAPARRSSRKAAEPAAAEPAAASGNADTSSASDTASAAAAGSASEPAATGVGPIVAEIGEDSEKLKAFVGTWTGGTDDQTERARRVQLLKDIAAKLGVPTQFGALIPHLSRVVFYIERDRAGATVDLTAEYDFAGDPAQEVAAAAAGDDDFG